MINLNVLLYIHAIVTWMLIGMIWFIQIVHYPLFDYIKKGFHGYERIHLIRTGYLFGPLMLIEVVTAIFLVGMGYPGIFSKLAALNLILLILVWISTFLFQINELQKLSLRFTKKMHHQLLRTNWVRVVIWTLRGVVVLMLFATLPPISYKYREKFPDQSLSDENFIEIEEGDIQ